MIKTFIKKIILQKPNWTVLLITGFIAGVLFRTFYGNCINLLETQYWEMMMQRLRDTKIEGLSLLLFILKERGAKLLILFALVATSAGKLILWIYPILIGAVGGILITSAIAQYGAIGILLFWAFLSPHYWLYYPVLIQILNLCWEMNTKMRGMERESGISKRNSFVITKSKGSFRNVLLWSVVVIIGLLLESYVNPLLVKYFSGFLYY